MLVVLSVWPRVGDPLKLTVCLRRIASSTSPKSVVGKTELWERKLGHRSNWRGVFEMFGGRSTPLGSTRTLFLRDVIDTKDGKPFRDHIWVQWEDGFQHIPLQQYHGDVVEFEATVAKYRHKDGEPGPKMKDIQHIRLVAQDAKA